MYWTVSCNSSRIVESQNNYIRTVCNIIAGVDNEYTNVNIYSVFLVSDA